MDYTKVSIVTFYCLNFFIHKCRNSFLKHFISHSMYCSGIYFHKYVYITSYVSVTVLSALQMLDLMFNPLSLTCKIWSHCSFSNMRTFIYFPSIWNLYINIYIYIYLYTDYIHKTNAIPC